MCVLGFFHRPRGGSSRNSSISSVREIMQCQRLWESLPTLVTTLLYWGLPTVKSRKHKVLLTSKVPALSRVTWSC